MLATGCLQASLSLRSWRTLEALAPPLCKCRWRIPDAVEDHRATRNHWPARPHHRLAGVASLPPRCLTLYNDRTFSIHSGTGMFDSGACRPDTRKAKASGHGIPQNSRKREQAYGFGWSPLPCPTLRLSPLLRLASIQFLWRGVQAS